MVMVGRSSALADGEARQDEAAGGKAGTRQEAAAFDVMHVSSHPLAKVPLKGGDYGGRLLQVRSDVGGARRVKQSTAKGPEMWHLLCWQGESPMQLFTTRALLKALLALAAGGPIAGRAFAQAFPTHPLRLVVPFAAGAGILDIMARLVSAASQRRLRPAGRGRQQARRRRQCRLGDRREGGARRLHAADRRPALVVSPYLYAHLDFDPLADFVGVTMVNSAPLLLVVHPSLPVKSVAEFIAYAKANPGKLNYGSGGVGATPYLAVELLKSMAGFDAVHVPYRGGAPALADLVAGQLSFMIENVPGTLPFVKDGKLRALAITSRERSALVPDLPTMIEAGVPGYEMVGWNGIFVPKGTGPKIVEKLHGELAEILRGAELREQFAKLGAEAVGNTPIAFSAFVKEEVDALGQDHPRSRHQARMSSTSSSAAGTSSG